MKAPKKKNPIPAAIARQAEAAVADTCFYCCHQDICRVAERARALLDVMHRVADAREIMKIQQAVFTACNRKAV